MSTSQPKTGAKCECRQGVERDNCPRCEGTGMVIDFKAIREKPLQPAAPVGGAQFTPGPWVAIKGDTFNPERPWGVSKYLSREAHIEIDGDDKEYPCRTEVIAELTETENPQEVEHTAYLIAAAPAMYEALQEARDYIRQLVDSKEDEAIDNLTNNGEDVEERLNQILAQAEGRQG